MALCGILPEIFQKKVHVLTDHLDEYLDMHTKPVLLIRGNYSGTLT